MFINWQERELNLKIVYYGPALSGKTTNLKQIYIRTDPYRRSQIVSLKKNKDRVLYFSFQQLELKKIGSMTPKIYLYTVSGKTYNESSRRAALRGADGIVFVADSAVNRMVENLNLWQNMKTHLSELNIPLTDLPIVVQFNKRDLPNALSTQTLKKLLKVDDYPTLEAVAMQGQGVLETLNAITNRTIRQIHREMA